MTAVTAVIAEDEPLLREELKELLNILWPELIICCEAADGLEALTAMRRYSPQVVFLDIHMPEMTGLDVAQEASGRSHVVFITAYDQYALQAFERGALDYVQKPLTAERLAITISRVKQRLSSAPPDLSGIAEMLRQLKPSEPQYLRWLTVPKGQELRLVTVEEICYLRAEDKYTTAVTEKDEFLLNSSLKQMREKLDPQRFLQIHRSIIVNLSAVDSVHRSFKGSMELKLKNRTEMLPVSSAHSHLFKHM